MNDTTQSVIRCCRRPRAMKQILVECGDTDQVRYTVYNLVRQGKLINLRADKPKTAGLFIVADEALRLDDDDAEALPPQLERFDASALVAAWQPRHAA